MRQRGEHAARTRARLVAAAHALLDRPESSALTVDEVARAAGVSRATAYNQFGSRRNLLAAVFEDQGRRIGYDRVLAALHGSNPRAAVTEVVRESCRAWSASPLAIRRTLALAVLDPEIGALVARYEGYRRAEIADLAHRLARAGLLASGLGRDEAAALLGAFTSFQAFDLVLAGGDARSAIERLLRMTTASLGIPPLAENTR